MVVTHKISLRSALCGLGLLAACLTCLLLDDTETGWVAQDFPMARKCGCAGITRGV